MIVVKAPLRVSFFGGGTDFPGFYVSHPEIGGSVLSTTIDKYIYVTVKQRFDEKICVNWREPELVDTIDDIKHELVRESLKICGVCRAIEVCTIADVPSRGCGLGSSSSLTVGLLKALSVYKKEELSAFDLASIACRIEIDVLGKPIGKQDQFAAAYGGINAIDFQSHQGKELILCNPVRVDSRRLEQLESRLLLFYTGIPRQSSDILTDQANRHKQNASILLKMRQQAIDARNLLEDDHSDLDQFGELLNYTWDLKQRLSPGISCVEIDQLYHRARKAGAIGGKICFTPGTLVRSTSGYVPIESLRIGDSVLDAYARPAVVTSSLIRDYSGNLLVLSVRGIPERLRVTPEHPFLVTENLPTGSNNISNILTGTFFLEARYLRRGQTLLEPIDDYVHDIHTIRLCDWLAPPSVEPSRGNSIPTTPNELAIGSELLSFIGWCAARCDILETYEITDVLKSLFSKVSSHVAVGNSDAAVLLHNLFGWGTPKQRLPDFVLHLPLDKQAIILRALWRGMGDELGLDSANSGIRRHYKTASPTLARQVQHLCHRLGYVTSLKLVRNRRSPSYRVTVYGDSTTAFLQFIKTGEIAPNHPKEIVTIAGTRYIKRPILEIGEEAYNGPVYNLSVDGSHTYTAEGLAVHNCGAGGGGFLLLYVRPENQVEVRQVLRDHCELPFRFERYGTRVLIDAR